MQLQYNVLFSNEVKQLPEDSIRYDASPPNSSELKEEFICYDANLDSYISPNPESQCSLCPNKYGQNYQLLCMLEMSIKRIHCMVAKWALSAEDNFEQGKILANTTSILLLLNDADDIEYSRSNVNYVTQVKKQGDIVGGDKLLLQSICLAYHYVKTNKDFRNICLDFKKFVAEL